MIATWFLVAGHGVETLNGFVPEQAAKSTSEAARIPDAKVRLAHAFPPRPAPVRNVGYL
jgi:hypothetical protein